MSDERRFDEREVGSILKRVAELHESESDTADPRSMTRAEIEHVVLAMGPLVIVGATLGWAVGRMWWSRRAAAFEGELRAAFGEIVALAGSRSRALPSGDE